MFALTTSVARRSTFATFNARRMVMNPTAISNTTSPSSLSALSTNVASFSSKPSYTERMEKTGRPVSPHVQIFAFPITAISSITTRVTGAGLSVGVFGASTYALVGGDVPAMMMCLGSLSVVGPVAKMVCTFPIVFHYLSGLRHIIWDKNPSMINTANVTEQSKYLFAAAGVLTVGAGLIPSS